MAFRSLSASPLVKFAMAIDNSNRIIVANGGFNGYQSIIRLTADGQLDSSFGTSGRAILNSSGLTDRVDDLKVFGDEIYIGGGSASSHDTSMQGLDFNVFSVWNWFRLTPSHYGASSNAGAHL